MKSDIVRANALVEAAYKPESVWQMRLLFAALAQISKDVRITHKTIFDVRLDTLADITGQKEKVLYRHLARAADELMDMTVVVQLNPDGSPRGRRKRRINLAAQCDYIEQEARVEMRFTDPIVPYITQLKSRFSQLIMDHIVPMQSTHSIRLYELLLSWSFAGEKEIELDELKVLMGIGDKYPKFYELRRWVLDVAVKEINEHTPLTVTMGYGAQGRGKTITHVQFKMTGVPAPALAEPPETPDPALPGSDDPTQDLVNKLSPDVFERATGLGLSEDKYSLAGEWAAWVIKQNIKVKNPDVHFFDFCKKRKAREQTK